MFKHIGNLVPHQDFATAIQSLGLIMTPELAARETEFNNGDWAIFTNDKIVVGVKLLNRPDELEMHVQGLRVLHAQYWDELSDDIFQWAKNVGANNIYFTTTSQQLLQSLKKFSPIFIPSSKEDDLPLYRIAVQ